MNDCHSDLHFKLVYEPGTDNGWNYLGVNIGIRTAHTADPKGGRERATVAKGAVTLQFRAHQP
jgi:hypothetical protein